MLGNYCKLANICGMSQEDPTEEGKPKNLLLPTAIACAESFAKQQALAGWSKRAREWRISSGLASRHP